LASGCSGLAADDVRRRHLVALDLPRVRAPDRLRRRDGHFHGGARAQALAAAEEAVKADRIQIALDGQALRLLERAARAVTRQHDPSALGRIAHDELAQQRGVSR
jgi:hypothetical protein